jgi:hypothetical protein
MITDASRLSSRRRDSRAAARATAARATAATSIAAPAAAAPAAEACETASETRGLDERGVGVAQHARDGVHGASHIRR